MARPVISKWAGVLFRRQLNAVLDWLEAEVSGDIARAEDVVLSTYGDTVSVSEKAKHLNKWGDNNSVGTSWETIMSLQGSETNETFVSTNLIDSVSSSDAADTSLTITIEGHTIDGSGNLTFAVQDVTTDASDGRTKVTLSTPLARATRAYVKNSGTFNSPQSAPAGNIYIYDDTDGITNGVPNTAAATKMMLDIGYTQSEKCATTISATDYWFISYFSAAISDASPTAGLITCRIERRDVANGGVWRPMGRDIILVAGGQGGVIEFSPYLIVPKNHDIRVRAQTDTGTAEIHAEVGGYLAEVQT